MKRVIVLMVVAVTMMLVGIKVLADQTPKGPCVLTGVVLGPDDRPVPHASVTYQSGGGNAPHALHADASGHFKITGLRADNYDMRASANGIFSEWEKNIVVRKGTPKQVTLRLIYAKKMPKTGTSKH